MQTPKKVYVTNAAGLPVFNLLLDTGEEWLMFSTPGGAVRRRDIERHGWELHPGWLDKDEARMQWKASR